MKIDYIRNNKKKQINIPYWEIVQAIGAFYLAIIFVWILICIPFALIVAALYVGGL